MEISKAAFGLAVAACVAAGAGGAYIATRNASPATVAQDTAGTPASGVEQSEVVLDSPAAPAEAPAVSRVPDVPAASAPRSRAAATSPRTAPAARNPRSAVTH